MEPNPYESPQTDQKQNPLTDDKSTDKNTGTAVALGCLMLPACFIAFFCVCDWHIGIQPTPMQLAAPFVAASLVAGGFIYAIVMVRKR